MSLRTTRSRTKAAICSQPISGIEHLDMPDSDRTTTFRIPASILSISAKPMSSLPPILTRKQTGLRQQSQILLLQKQRALRTLHLPSTHTKQEYFASHSTFSRASNRYPLQHTEEVNISNAVSSTLVFAGGSGGTAVCIHESGLILTFAHCIAESRDEFEQDHGADKRKPLWLLMTTGDIVSANCVAWDERRDLALLRVVSSQNLGLIASQATVCGENSESNASQLGFASLRMSSSRPALKTMVVCIGQPGSEDLEAGVEGIHTGYPALAISRCQFLGYAKGQDIEDNSEIGALRHDAWTYWGHSGAPIVDFHSEGGCLIGLYSSWDDQTGTRRGVGIEAIRGFMDDIDQTLQSGNPSDIVVRP